MFRFVLAALIGFMLMCANAQAGKGGYWVMEYLLCMESAESAGLPREDARMQCSQTLAESGDWAEHDPFHILYAFWFSQANIGLGGSWVMEYLLCMESAESAGLPREDARMQCSQTLAESGDWAEHDPSAPLTLQSDSPSMELLLCVEQRASEGLSPEEARMQCEHIPASE